MVSRRAVLGAAFGFCSLCTGFVGLAASTKKAAADQPTHIHGRGYDLYYVGAQRETVMNGRVAGAIELSVLRATPSLYGLGPIAELRGEVTIVDGRPSLSRVGADGKIQVTESFQTGAPFLVWAELPSWRDIPIHCEVRSFADLEKFVPHAAEQVGLDAKDPFPFLVRGRMDFIEFHILNRIGNEPHNAERHRQIQVPFEITQVEAIIVGFHAPHTAGFSYRWIQRFIYTSRRPTTARLAIFRHSISAQAQRGAYREAAEQNDFARAGDHRVDHSNQSK